MRAIVTAVVAAIEGCVAAVAGLAVVALPALALWIFTFGISAEPEDVFSAIAGVWLLAHLVPMEFSLAQESMLAMGLGSEALSFGWSLVPLALTLVTVGFAVRAGQRLGHRGGLGTAGLLGGGLGFGAVAAGAVLVADAYTRWSIVEAAVVAAAVYFGVATLAFVVTAAIVGARWWRVLVRSLQFGLEYLGLQQGVAAFPARAATVLRLACASFAAALLVAAVGLAVALAVGFADVIALAQALQLDALGSVLMFIGQLVFVPTGVIWSLAWLSGAGFTAGAEFSPFVDGESQLPMLPMLGSMPGSWGAFGLVAPVLMVLVNVAVGVLLTRGTQLRRVSWVVALVLPALAAVITGMLAAGASVLGSGAMGPGSLSAVGPDAWLTGGLIAGETAVGLMLGVTAARLDYARLERVLPEPVSRWSANRAATGAALDVSASEAETVDLSSVRGDDAASIPDEASEEVSPVVDLFASVLHATDLPETDLPETDLTEAAPPDPLVPTPRPELEAFDIERAGDTGEASEVASTPAPPSAEEPDETEDFEAIERAFAWDASDPLVASQTDPRKPGNGEDRGGSWLGKWRTPKGKG